LAAQCAVPQAHSFRPIDHPRKLISFGLASAYKHKKLGRTELLKGIRK
jgi:hypothetical protein